MAATSSATTINRAMAIEKQLTGPDRRARGRRRTPRPQRERDRQERRWLPSSSPSRRSRRRRARRPPGPSARPDRGSATPRRHAGATGGTPAARTRRAANGMLATNSNAHRSLERARASMSPDRNAAHEPPARPPKATNSSDRLPDPRAPGGVPGGSDGGGMGGAGDPADVAGGRSGVSVMAWAAEARSSYANRRGAGESRSRGRRGRIADHQHLQIADVGVGRPGADQIAEPIERVVGVVVGEARVEVHAQIAAARQRRAVDEAARRVRRTIDRRRSRRSGTRPARGARRARRPTASASSWLRPPLPRPTTRTVVSPAPITHTGRGSRRETSSARATNAGPASRASPTIGASIVIVEKPRSMAAFARGVHRVGAAADQVPRRPRQPRIPGLRRLRQRRRARRPRGAAGRPAADARARRVA